ncbi:MAG: hypothetical protein HC906_06415 [Bacteroidales bacterium]|nr:hypothetical protein [Bacteroidales bacterium]
MEITYWWEGVEDGFFMPFAIRTNNGGSLRFEATSTKKTDVLEGVSWFNFYNEWQDFDVVAHNALTYFNTRWHVQEIKEVNLFE